MYRAAIILGLTAAFAGAAVAVAQTPDLAAKVAACETGAEPSDRFAVFTGSMPRDGAVRMAMRFDLYERLRGTGYVRVPLANWGVWEKTGKKGAPGFIFNKRIEQLAAPAAFRAVVSFRWYDAKGRVVRTARLTSKACRQPDWRPDLEVKRVTFPDRGDVAGPIKVLVSNRGRGEAGPFAVHVSRSDIIKGHDVAGLPAGEQATVAVRLGRCKPGEPVTVTLDPAGVVAEADEAGNVMTVACPS